MKFSYRHLQSQFWNKLRFSVTINFHLQKIICNWWLHDLWMIHNPVIKRLLYLLIDHWIPFSILFQLPWCISRFNFLALIFSSSNSTLSSIFFTSTTLVNIHSVFLALGFVEFTICVYRNSYGLTKTKICINTLLISLLDR